MCPCIKVHVYWPVYILVCVSVWIAWLSSWRPVHVNVPFVRTYVDMDANTYIYIICISICISIYVYVNTYIHRYTYMCMHWCRMGSSYWYDMNLNFCMHTPLHVHMHTSGYATTRYVYKSSPARTYATFSFSCLLKRVLLDGNAQLFGPSRSCRSIRPTGNWLTNFFATIGSDLSNLAASSRKQTQQFLRCILNFGRVAAFQEINAKQKHTCLCTQFEANNVNTSSEACFPHALLERFWRWRCSMQPEVVA